MDIQQQKAIGLVVFNIGYSLLFFLLISLLFRDGWQWTTFSGIMVAVAALVWTAIIALAFALFPLRSRTGITHVVLLASALFIADLFSLASIVGALLIGTALLLAHRSIQNEIANTVRFSIYRMFSNGIRIILLVVVISIVALALPVVQRAITAGELEVPDYYISAMIRPFIPLMGQYFEGYQEGDTVDDIVNRQLAQEQANLPPGFAIPPGQADQIKRDLSERLGITVHGHEDVPTLAAMSVNNYIRGLADQNGFFVIVGLIVIILLLFRATIPFLVWPVFGILYLILYAAKQIGFVYTATTQVYATRIHL